jgi:maltose/maltodextrin transport system substrate-binding protein
MMKNNTYLFFLSCGILISLWFIGCTHGTVSKHPGAVPGYYANGPAGHWDSADWKRFHQLAAEESLIPVRPGQPGISPFWNGHAKRFINVPSFQFNTVRNAVKYRYKAVSDRNTRSYTFEAEDPWSLLTPVWKELPVGMVYLKVEGLDKDNEVIGTAGERMFHKAAAFKGPYNLPVRDYKSSVILNMESLLGQQHYIQWKTDTIPSQYYRLYCYPSKIIGSIIQAMTMYAGLSEKDREDALSMARNAARYLISTSMPGGSALEHFPRTYEDRSNTTNIARQRKDQLMMFYPAITGSAYLDLYDATGDNEYLEASIRIAGTYAKTQLPEGSWPLMVWIESGESIEQNLVVPTDIINFLDRLVQDYGKNQFSETSEKAFRWIMEHPVKTFHWEGQFEDIGYSKHYSNMERGKPFSFAVILLSRIDREPGYIKLAEELIRFAEDQFVVWEQPLSRELFRTAERQIPGRSYLTDTWLTPCVLEQYSYYTPIDASSASAILAYKKAYEVTGKDLYLAKAITLADNQTVAQELGGGIYPTYQMALPGWNWSTDPAQGGSDTNPAWSGWLNCATVTAKALLELNELVSPTD